MSAFRAGRWNAYAAVAAASHDEQQRQARVVCERVEQEHDGDRREPEVGDEQEAAAVDRVGDRAGDDRDREQRDERRDPEQARP